MKLNTTADLGRHWTQFTYTHAEQTTPQFIPEAVRALAGITLACAASGALVTLLAAWAAALRSPLRWSAAGGATLGVVGLVMGLVLFRKMIFTRQIIDNEPPELPAPPPPPQTTHYDLHTPDNNLRRGEFKVPSGLLADFCQAAYREESLSFARWVPLFCRALGANGRQSFEQFRADWINRGLAYNAGGNQGLRLSDDGWLFAEAILKAQGRLQLAEPTPPPAATAAADQKHA